MTKKLERALEEQKQSTKQEVQQFSGELGIPLGGTKVVEVPNRKGYVYVRLRSNLSEVIQAFNNQVAPSYNLPVLVERQGNRYVVMGVDTQRYENNWTSRSPYLPRHGNTHSFDLETSGGGDVVWVYPRQFMPALVFPSGSLGGPNVIVSPYTLKNADGSWKYVGGTGTPNITNYNPTSSTGAVMGLVYLDTNDGNPYLVINSGTVFLNSITGTNQIVSYIPSLPDSTSQIPLAAIRLITGTSQISWNNIYDIRQFLHSSPSGTGGGGSITVQDEGIAQGTATVFNFVGDNVQATVAGGTARIFITGSIGGSSINTGTLDARYLKLDASNDPVTGPLDINSTLSVLGENGIGANLATITQRDYQYNALKVIHNISGSTPAEDSTVLVNRQTNGDSSFPFAAYDVIDTSSSGTIYGGALTARYNGTQRLILNHQATGTVPNYILDTVRTRPTGTIHTSWRVLGNEQAYLDVSGTFYSNGSPLVKEAPVDGNPYARKSAGWIEAPLYLPFGVYTNISPLSASPSYPYAATVDRTYNFIKWSQGVYVDTTNNGTNYWTLELIRWTDDAQIAYLSTSGSSANTHTLLSTTSFTSNSIATSGVGVILRATKTGNPGVIYTIGPMVKISV